MTDLHINAERLLGRLQTLGNVGRDADGKLTRLAASDADRAGRDAVAGWMREAGLEVMVDRIGNLFGLWEAKADDTAPLMLGSHIDTVINAGIYDAATVCWAGWKWSRRSKKRA